MSSSQSLQHSNPGHAGHPEAVVSQAIRLGAVGAVVGSVSALPAAYDGARSGAIPPEQAVRQVIRAGSHAALATGVGVVAASLAGSNGLVRLAAMLVAGGLTLHALAPDRPDAPARPTAAAG